MSKQKKAVQEPRLHYNGSSLDLRTNRWRVHCACGYENNPNTTMFAHQMVTCDRCMRVYSCNYNDKTIEEIAQ